MSSNRNSVKIGIIGGGPAGLSAAWKLMETGYNNVTVLEKEREVGGKCLTIEATSGNLSRKYELGAEYITYAYDTIFNFIDMLGVNTVPTGDIAVLSGGGVFGNPIDEYPLREVIPAMKNYLRLAYMYRTEIRNPCNSRMADDPVLSLSTQELIDQNNLQALSALMLVRQFGYGSLDDFPAINQFRCLPYDLLIRIIVDQMPEVAKSLGIVVSNAPKEVRVDFLGITLDLTRPVSSYAEVGTQGLFKLLADRLNSTKERYIQGEPAIVTEEEVQRIEQKEAPDSNPGRFVITTRRATYEFDKVICAIPPKFLAEIMALPQTWEQHFTKIAFNPYWVGLMEIDRPVPKYYYQNLELGPNEPSQLGERYEHPGDMLIWGYNSDYAEAANNNDPSIDVRLESFMEDKFLVESYTKTEFSKYWEFYHPHVTYQQFREEKYYDRLEQFQGYSGGIYLAGSAMSHESMEYACKYSIQLVERFFN